MNKVFLVGRLARDVDLRYSGSNNAIGRTSIAVDRPFNSQTGERGTDFIGVVAFGSRAETMQKYLRKGSQIAINGRIQTGSYDAADGHRVYTTDVVIDEFQFLDSKSSRNDSEMSSNSVPIGNVNVTPYDFETSDNSTNDVDPFKDFGDKIEVDDSDLPF